MPKSMATETSTLSPVDVYDIAATIGKEFEKIIDSYGPEAVTELMPKIITVLEQLEILANNNQKENVEIAELKLTIERLQANKKAKAEERVKYEKELEQIEESWRLESQQLTAAVSQLQEENRRIRTALNDREGQDEQLQKEEDEEVTALRKESGELKNKVHEYRDRARSLQRELGQKNVDLEAMQSQLERLAKLNAEYRRKTTLTQKRSENLIQEKTDLEAQLHDKEQHITRIKDRLKEQHNSMEASTISEGTISPRTSVSEEDMDKLEERLQLEGKMLIDMKDPDRPRFTLHELREVLQERNELKTKLIEVEEELHHYKPEPQTDSYDLPVQGPINKEPEEKLYPDKVKESGIRKFFKFLRSPGRSRYTPPPVIKRESPARRTESIVLLPRPK